MQKGYWLVLLTALVSGVSIFLNKFGVQGINPYVFTWGKNISVTMLLFSTILAFRQFKILKGLNPRQWIKLAVIGFFGGSVPFLLFFKGLSMAPSDIASLLHKSMFIFVTVLAIIFLKEKINRTFLISVILLFAGNLILLKIKAFNFSFPELLVLIAVLLWSIETTISKHCLKEIPSTIVAFGRMFFGSLFILMFLAATGDIIHLASLTASNIGWVLFTSLLLFLYVTTWYSGLSSIQASTATCILVLGSAITTLLNILQTGMVDAAKITSVALILTGVLVLFGETRILSKLRLLLPSKN